MIEGAGKRAWRIPAWQGEGLGCCKGGSLLNMHRCQGEELGALKGTACLPQQTEQLQSVPEEGEA